MGIERMTNCFEKHGKGHAGETPRIAMDASKERDFDNALISSTTGWTALEALKGLEVGGLNLIFVPHQTGYVGPGVQLMHPETRIRDMKLNEIPSMPL